MISEWIHTFKVFRELIPSKRNFSNGRENSRRFVDLFLFLLILMFLLPVRAGGEAYKYQDENGTWHFTDDPGKIPQNKNDKLSKKMIAGKRVHLGGGYSIELPGNWKAAKRGSLRYKLVFTKETDGFEPGLGLDEFRSRRSLKEFEADLLKTLKKRFKNFEKISRSSFPGDFSKGVKVVLNYEYQAGMDVRTIHYLFENPREGKIVLTCRVAKNTGTRFDADFDKMAQSLNIE